MYLYSYRKRPNFGDALNDYLWPRFIQAPLETQPGSDEVFVGIGTLLNERLPPKGILHIFGSGAGYGRVQPDAINRWRVHFVRGPLTAKTLGLDPELAISDPGILVHDTHDLNSPKDIECAFMPHHGLYSEHMKDLCEQAGVHFIHPEAPCESVLDQIARSRRLVCSAMHGAIAAEALRVPWLPVTTNREMLLSKWDDWAASIDTSIRFRSLPVIWSKTAPSIVGKAAARLKAVTFRQQLARLSRSQDFRLGSDSVLNNRLSRIREHIEIFNSQQPLRREA
ncbi:polysaccharide pyruvyl transferase family protein [Thioalkalivibrio sp. AKL10]|uniref:polysaccharide pyruvyl transferase family protein n=1 Tax=Thioalkalivibrio sp. AKL10 TaxID=1158158 RepID=UPI00037B6B3A|nr:polysaccharide pyruvyl transferase family protein [Thioalkalivibrio sp. AKL10]